MHLSVVQFALNYANVNFRWPLVWPQYAPPETQPRLHNNLGLSQRLKTGLTGPQIGAKTAAIAMPLQAKWFKVHHIENGMVSTYKICQISSAL